MSIDATEALSPSLIQTLPPTSTRLRRRPRRRHRRQRLYLSAPTMANLVAATGSAAGSLYCAGAGLKSGDRSAALVVPSKISRLGRQCGRRTVRCGRVAAVSARRSVSVEPEVVPVTPEDVPEVVGR